MSFRIVHLGVSLNGVSKRDSLIEPMTVIFATCHKCFATDRFTHIMYGETGPGPPLHNKIALTATSQLSHDTLHLCCEQNAFARQRARKPITQGRT